MSKQFKRLGIDLLASGGTDVRVRVSVADTTSGFLDSKLAPAVSGKITKSIANPAGNEVLELDVDDSQIDHDALLNYDVAQHRTINDVGVAVTDLWSADKIGTELNLKQDVSEKGNANGYASLDGTGKLPASQLTVTAMEYKGAWNASTNTPTLIDGTGTTGDVYRASVAGTQDLGSGSQAFAVGDALIYNGTIWEKIPANDAVVSVFGRVGIVTAQTSDYDAIQIDFDNVASGLTATNAQAAIDEVEGRLDTVETGLSDHLADTIDAHDATAISYNNATSGLAATEVQAAIDEVEGRVDVVEPRLNNVIGTGILTGGTTTFVDGTHFAISDGTGIIVDHSLDPNNPTVTEVSWSGFSNVLVSNLLQPATYVAINNLGAVVQQNTNFTETQVRDLIVVGTIIHPSGVIGGASNIDNFSVPVYSPITHIKDLTSVIGIVNRSGNVYEAALNNLTIKKNAGDMYKFGVNCTTVPKNPSIASLIAVDPISSVYFYDDGAGDPTVEAPSANVKPGFYDDGDGTLGTVSINDWTVQRIYTTVGNDTFISYGRTSYNNINEARQRFLTENVFTPAELTNAILRGYLFVRGGATDLSDIGDADFLEAGKFGIGVAGGATGAENTLQEIYDNSSSGDIVVSPIVGPVSVKDAATPTATTLFSVENNAGTTSFVDINTSGMLLETGSRVNAILDENTMVSDSDTALATQQSIKAYVDNTVGGVGSPGDIAETTFAGANNVIVFADITGLAFNNAVVRSFEVQMSIVVDATADLYEIVTLKGIQRASDWVLSVSSTGDNSLVTFEITAAGQVQYKSGNYVGFVSLGMRFRALTLSV